MYYTCTVNPALDYFIKAPNLEIGKLNRVKQGTYRLGGKGIIVSRILRILSQNTTAIGFSGGFTGEYFVRELNKEGIQTQFIQTEDPLRINVILESSVETDINTSGPQISKEVFTLLLQFIEQTITKDDTLFLCGNVAPGISPFNYLQICEAVTKVGARLIVDTNTQLLTEALKSRPFLIKPNHIEIGEILGKSLDSVSDCLEAAKEIQVLGARNVLISRGGDGAIFLSEDRLSALQVNVAKVTNGKQTIGAGDTMLASFISKFDQTNCFEQALAFASAAGGATVESDDLATIQLIDQFSKEIHVKKI